MQSGKIGKIARVEMAVNFHEAHRQRDLTNVKQEDVDWEAFQFGGRITADVFQGMVEYQEGLVTFAMSLTNAAGNRSVWYGNMANFLRRVRSRETPRASVDNGFQHAVARCMAAVSLESGRGVSFDRQRLEIG